MSPTLGSTVRVTVTLAEPCAGTVTLGALNTTCVSVSQNSMSAGNVPVVPIASTFERSYVTLELELFVSVSVRVAGPAWLSPSESFPGTIAVVALIASSMSTIPAPCRCTLSRNPSPGFRDQTCGSALFCSTPRNPAAGSDGWASIRRAAAPATWGDDMDVPLIVAYPPPGCSSGYVERMRPPGAPMSGFRLSSASVP